jgi:hypothetical protein
MSNICEPFVLDITEQEQAQSDAPAFGGVEQRRPETLAAHPPSKFNRRHARFQGEASSPKQQVVRPDFSCIQATRRRICDQIYDSELCPEIGKPQQEDLWASLDGMFMQ